MRTILCILAANVVAVSIYADTLHVPTPKTANELVGLCVRMFDEIRKAQKDDPIQVEIEFSREVKVDSCELIVRKSGASIGTFTAEFRRQESTLKDGHSFFGYSFQLAPSALAESYLSIDLDDPDDHFYVPLLRFIPERHIEKKTREASPDYRDEVSQIYYQEWPVKPNFLQNADDGRDPPEGLPRKTGREILEERGVRFPAGSVYYYGLPTLQIAVQNTEDNLQKIEMIVKELNR